VRIEIYPGEEPAPNHESQQYGPLSSDIWDGRLVVYVDNQPLAPTYRIFGGPRHTVSPPGEHPAHPTHPGRYVLDAPEAHVSGSWADAEVPTGAFLRRDGDHIRAKFTARGQHRDIVLNQTRWYREKLEAELLSNQDALRRLSDANVERNMQADILGRYASSWEGDPAFASDVLHRTTPKFSDNPFGPWSFRLNMADGRRGKQHLHTTADNFQRYLESPGTSTGNLYRTLGSSHGCVHIAWKHLKALIAYGYAKRGVPVLIHRYEERYKPNRSAEDLAP
jgi:hypothetical protein